MKNKGKCETPSCTEPAACAGLCKPCYSGVYYWKKKGVAAVMARRQRLVIIGERLEHLRPANVHHLRRRA